MSDLSDLAVRWMLSDPSETITHASAAAYPESENASADHPKEEPMDEETRQKIVDAYEALQADNHGVALEILWRLLGYDQPLP